MNENQDKQNNGNINIKSKSKINKYKRILIIILIILAGFTLGLILSNHNLSNLNSKQIDENKDSIDDIKTEVMTQENITRVIQKVAPCLVSIGNSEENAKSTDPSTNNLTGVVITRDGLIATSYSGIKDFKNIFVKLPSRGIKTMKAVLLGYNKDADVAIIMIPVNNLEPISLASDKDVRPGDITYAIGNSVNDNYVGIITSGIVTSMIDKVKINNTKYNLIQTNAVMNSKNYGGVLCNADGQLIGINSKYLTNKDNNYNLYYAYSSRALEAVTREVIKKLDILGIRGSEAKVNNEYKKGFYIESLTEGGRAAKAGLKATDIILTADGKTILSYEDLSKAVKNSKNKTINFKLLRDGNIISANVPI